MKSTMSSPVFVTGKLLVQKIQGSNGEFSVGKLESQIGPLTVKDPSLDQYPEGTYTGRFAISRIYSHGYSSRSGAFIVEVRAVIDEYLIHNDEPSELEESIGLVEADPLETPALDGGNKKAKKPSKPSPPTQQQENVVPVPPEAILFGELWPLGSVVKLDPTSMRSEPDKHRERCAYLNRNGYSFKANLQAFVKL